VSHVPGQIVPKPADLARDLLRLGRVASGPHAPLDEAFFRSLPPDARGHFLDSAGNLKPEVAFIGDARNDENLVIAQLHLAMVRLHNRIVDHAHQDPTAPTGDRDALFHWARRQVSWIHQWLVVNAFLPAICDPEVLREVNRDGPRLYDALIARNPPPAPGLLPRPLEFSAAAFRFGHSMIRGEDDWNRFHGRGGAGASATLRDLFADTGGAAVPFGGLPRLPSHWPIEWDRFVEGSPARYPDRSPMPIDTSLTATLGALPNVDAGHSGRMRQLAARNLRRGYLLNLPSAQACIAALQTGFGIAVRPLSRAELTGGPTGGAVAAGGFERDTPLWFYVLKEAEVIGGGNRLGPLGSRLVADTLVGLVRHDPESCWRQGAPRTWSPRDGVMPDGVTILSMADMMTAARLL
jgi:hypothetical protein